MRNHCVEVSRPNLIDKLMGHELIVYAATGEGHIHSAPELDYVGIGDQRIVRESIVDRGREHGGYEGEI